MTLNKRFIAALVGAMIHLRLVEERKWDRVNGNSVNESQHIASMFLILDMHVFEYSVESFRQSFLAFGVEASTYGIRVAYP